MDWRPILFDMQLATSRPPADDEERVARARALVDARFAEPLDLERLARAACLSPFHFHRRFKALTGDTPHEYLTRRRVETARRLLLTTEMSVTDVCFEVGFHSLGSFSTLFRRHTGSAPGRYRRLVVQSLGVPKPRPHLAPVPSCFLRMFAPA